MNEIINYTMPNATLTVNWVDYNSAEISYFISDFNSGSNYKINVINTTMGQKEQTIYLEQEADTFEINNLVEASIYQLDMWATYYDESTYEDTTAIIAKQQFVTSSVPVYLDSTEPIFYAFWGGWAFGIIALGLAIWSFFFKRKTNSNKKNRRQRRKQQQTTK